MVFVNRTMVSFETKPDSVVFRVGNITGKYQLNSNENILCITGLEGEINIPLDNLKMERFNITRHILTLIQQKPESIVISSIGAVILFFQEVILGENILSCTDAQTKFMGKEHACVEFPDVKFPGASFPIVVQAVTDSFNDFNNFTIVIGKPGEPPHSAT